MQSLGGVAKNIGLSIELPLEHLELPLEHLKDLMRIQWP
jgi:hypothetical protein